MNAGATQEAEFKDIARKSARGKGDAYVSAVEAYADFVGAFSGGKDKPILLEMEAYMRALSAVREIPPELFKQLASLRHLISMPLYVAAFVKATVGAPKSCVRGDTAKVFTTNDFNATRDGKVAQVAAAHAIMLAARDFGSSQKVEGNVAWTRIVGDLDVRLVTHVHEQTFVALQTFHALN